MKLDVNLPKKKVSASFRLDQLFVFSGFYVMVVLLILTRMIISFYYVL